MATPRNNIAPLADADLARVIDLAVRLKFQDLLLLQSGLAEHIANIWAHHLVRSEQLARGSKPS